MDYLLRDSHHAGVAYGKFDYFRLIDTLRILPREEGGSIEPALGVEEGGLHSAEALLLARYFMYTQLYFHPVRRIYDHHLKDFLAEWLPSGRFSINIEDLLNITDNEVTSAMLKAARETHSLGHHAASSIINRQHFRVIYQRNPEDIIKNLKAAEIVYDVLKERYGEGLVKFDTYKQKGSGPNFPVLVRDGRIISSLATSETLKNLPVVAIDFVFISPEYRQEAQKWLESNLESIIRVKEV
ncbi:MAG: hypothetical protein M0Z31_07810 [Clostridia bacterium]|nr:hypothetical protein [Clostridia bacterium]